MQGKLRQLMKHEGINSTRLAEMLGIQASGISHIMSGRNKPSFDFLLKLLQRFPQINPDWLLLDKGPMYRDEIKQKSGAGNSFGPRSVAGAGGVGGSGNIEGSENFGGSGSIGGSGNFEGSANFSGARSVGTAAAGSGGSGNSGNFGAVGSVGMGTRGVGGSGSGSSDRAAIFGDTGASEGLFGPDNNDIISAGSHTEGHPGYISGGHPGGYPAGHPGAQTNRQSASPISQPNTPPNASSNTSQNAPQTAQHAVYQSGGFTKSASIERIVVFYKDKTFSEYQPE